MTRSKAQGSERTTIAVVQRGNHFPHAAVDGLRQFPPFHAPPYTAIAIALLLTKQQEDIDTRNSVWGCQREDPADRRLRRALAAPVSPCARRNMTSTLIDQPVAMHAVLRDEDGG
ncbi:hypothetical protein GCM10027186_40850 [Micromonospora schwarzwaldensis]